MLSLMVVLSLSPSVFAQTVQERVSQAFDRRQKMDLLVGADVGVIQSNGTEATIELGDVTSPHDLFEIGSISKSFAGIVLAELVQEGRVSLDAPIAKYIPEFTGSFAGTITLRQLATHTARLTRDAPASVAIGNDPQPLIDFLKAYTPSPEYPQGKRQYSNLGFATLALVLSRVEGTDYPAVVQKRVLTPFKMSETSFLSSEAVFPRLLPALDMLLHPTWKDLLNPYFSASGGIYSNGQDMMRFLKLNLHPDLLPELAAAIRLSQSQGLGWDSLPGAHRIQKNGAMTGYGSDLEFDPAEAQGAFGLTHSANTPSITGVTETALGVADTFPMDPVPTRETASKAVGLYLDSKTQKTLKIVTTPHGYLGIEIKLGSISYGESRLVWVQGNTYRVISLLHFNDQVVFQEAGKLLYRTLDREHSTTDQPVYLDSLYAEIQDIR